MLGHDHGHGKGAQAVDFQDALLRRSRRHGRSVMGSSVNSGKAPLQ